MRILQFYFNNERLKSTHLHAHFLIPFQHWPIISSNFNLIILQ